MEIDLTEVCNYLKDNYTELPKSTIIQYDKKYEFVIFATGGFDGEYGYGSSDLEAYGVDKDGKLYLIYASGCSCYCNTEFEEKTIKIIQMQVLTQDFQDGINKAYTLFTNDKEEFKKSISGYEYSDY